jgi:hypothetical protein
MKAFLILLLCVTSVSLIGCETFGSKKSSATPAMLEPQSILKFSDIPVPAGFKLIIKESYSFESTGVRVGVTKYLGKADIEQVVVFYKEQMPMYNWNLLNIVEYGDRMLNFDRDNETCIVTLIPKGNQVTIAISVGPKSQTYKKSQKPVK